MPSLLLLLGCGILAIVTAIGRRLAPISAGVPAIGGYDSQPEELDLDFPWSIEGEDDGGEDYEDDDPEGDGEEVDEEEDDSEGEEEEVDESTDEGLAEGPEAATQAPTAAAPGGGSVPAVPGATSPALQAPSADHPLSSQEPRSARRSPPKEKLRVAAKKALNARVVIPSPNLRPRARMPAPSRSRGSTASAPRPR